MTPFKLNSSRNSQEAIPNKKSQKTFFAAYLLGPGLMECIYLHLFLALGLGAATSMGRTHFATAVNMGVPKCPTRIRK